MPIADKKKRHISAGGKKRSRGTQRSASPGSVFERSIPGPLREGHERLLANNRESSSPSTTQSPLDLINANVLSVD